jgi:hypothetical protein
MLSIRKVAQPQQIALIGFLGATANARRALIARVPELLFF